MSAMRLLAVLLGALALACPAAASSTPRFAVWDLQSDLATVSRNTFGDVAAKPRAAVDGRGTLVRCGTWCRFSPGWLAFRAKPQLDGGDVTAVKVAHSKRLGWEVQATLTRPALERWSHLAQLAAERSRRRGVPDVLLVAARGVVVASPYSSDVRTSHGRLVLSGFTGRAAANAVVRALR
jgi:hypothetical protein